MYEWLQTLGKIKQELKLTRITEIRITENRFKCKFETISNFLVYYVASKY